MQQPSQDDVQQVLILANTQQTQSTDHLTLAATSSGLNNQVQSQVILQESTLSSSAPLITTAQPISHLQSLLSNEPLRQVPAAQPATIQPNIALGQDYVVILPPAQSALTTALPSVQVGGQSLVMSLPKGQSGLGAGLSNQAIIQQAVAQVRAQQAKAKAQAQQTTVSKVAPTSHVQVRHIQPNSPILTKVSQVAVQQSVQKNTIAAGSRSPQTQQLVPKVQGRTTHIPGGMSSKQTVPNHGAGDGYVQASSQSPHTSSTPQQIRQQKAYNAQKMQSAIAIQQQKQQQLQQQQMQQQQYQQKQQQQQLQQQHQHIQQQQLQQQQTIGHMLHTSGMGSQPQHIQSPSNPPAVTSQGQLPDTHNSTTPNPNETNSEPQSASGQTITVEAVECRPMQGQPQSRRLIKLVVSGAKGQAHNLLSKNNQLQAQILQMMQKAKTSTAEVSFPADNDQPIKITCKSNSDTKVSPSDANQSTPSRMTSPQTPDGQHSQHMGSPTGSAPLGMRTPVPNFQNPGMIRQRGMTPRGPVMTPRQMGHQRLRSPPHTTTRGPQPRGAMGMPRQLNPRGMNQTQYRNDSNKQHMQEVQNKDYTAAMTYAARPGSVQPSGFQQQFAQQQLQSKQQQAGSITPDGQGKLALPGALVSPSNLQGGQGNRPLKVSSVDDGGDLSVNKKLIEGNEYTIDCPNGKKILGIWDGKYFKVKNALSQADIGGGQIPTSNNITVSQADGATLVTSDGLKLTGDIGQRVRILQGNAQSTSVNSNKVDAEPARPEGELEKAPTPPIRKRPPLPREEGKYAVCENCGNLSQDYENCEGCKKPLPDEPRFFMQTGLQKHGEDGEQREKTASASLKAKQFYGNKMTNQMLLLTKAGVGRGKGPIITRGGNLQKTPGKGRGRMRKSPLEPETVTILSSGDEEDDEMQGPYLKQPRLDPSATPGQDGRLSRRFRMEDESGKIIAKKPVALPANVSAAKASEHKQGSGNVVRLVDPVIKLSCQNVRMGSMQTSPVKNVEFSLKGFLMMLKLPTTGAAKIVDIRVEQRDILELQVSYSKFMVMFIRVTPHCAARIKHRIGPCQNNEKYFDPDSTLECHRFITILMNSWPSRDQEIFKAICRKLETDNLCAQPKILYPMLPEKANDMLIQASYVPAQKKIMGSTQLLTQTSSGLILGQNTVLTQVLQVPVSGGQGLILALPGTSQGVPRLKSSSVNGEDEEEEPMDRSRSPSPLLPSFSGPVIKLFTYPPPPATGGICVTNEDLYCLNEGEFLNDVIIDFYLKYLFNEIFSDGDKERTHVFSSFFYRRLTQKQAKRVGQEDTNLTAQQKRHSRVKTWTRHVNLFEKDFIIVPINESAHWYLAIICFPGLTEPLVAASAPEQDAQSESSRGSCDQNAAGKLETPQEEASKEQEKPESGSKPATPQPEEASAPSPAPSQHGSDKNDTTKEPQPRKMIKNIMQPCILIFDSLSGPGRTSVVRTLREYLQVEWDVKKAATDGARTLTKDNMKGAVPKCPQQTNFSDCGVFVLQYVESFFKNPIHDYSIPLPNLGNWFSEDCVKQKREELRLLILDLQQELNPDLDYDPAQDGCLGISPSTMVTVPISTETTTPPASTAPTPVITSVASGGEGALDAAAKQDEVPPEAEQGQEGQDSMQDNGQTDGHLPPGESQESEGGAVSQVESITQDGQQPFSQEDSQSGFCLDGSELQERDLTATQEYQSEMESGEMYGVQQELEYGEEEVAMDTMPATEEVDQAPGDVLTGQSGADSEGQTSEVSQEATALAEADSTQSPCQDQEQAGS